MLHLHTHQSSAERFMSDLAAEITNHPFFNTPFVRRMATAGDVTLAHAKRFGLLYYPHVFRTRLYQASALGLTPAEPVQYALAQLLYDEFGEGNAERTHPSLYRRFLHACGATDEEMSISPRIPEVAEYIATMESLTRTGDWLVAVGAAGIASEWPIPLLYTLWLTGLRGITELREEHLTTFSLHVTMDDSHSDLLLHALLPYAEESDAQERIRSGVRLNLEARVRMMDGLYREVFAAN